MTKIKKNMALDEQIAALHATGSPSTLYQFRWALVALALGLTVVGLLARRPLLLIAAAFIAIVYYSARRTAPHLLNAVEALTSAQQRPSPVHFSNIYDSTHCQVTADGWTFEAVPLGWQPPPGRHDAELYFIDRAPWPVLLMTDKGLLYPRDKPTQTSVGGR